MFVKHLVALAMSHCKCWLNTIDFYQGSSFLNESMPARSEADGEALLRQEGEIVWVVHRWHHRQGSCMTLGVSRKLSISPKQAFILEKSLGPRNTQNPSWAGAKGSRKVSNSYHFKQQHRTGESI